MPWTDAYWDIISNLYWTPRYLGLKSIPRDKWRADGDWVSVPRETIANSSGPLYSRVRRFDELRVYLESQEEILNHFFNLTFSIAADSIVGELLFRPLGFDEPGPIASFGREIGARYGWSAGENVTQQDGFFVGQRSIVGVELKLGSRSWPEQIAKYAALMMWEEAISGPRQNLGLIFIVPETDLPGHWPALGLKGPIVDHSILERFERSKLPKRIQDGFDKKPEDIRSVLDRLVLEVTSWQSLSVRISALESHLSPKLAGDQTLGRLLGGFRQQIEQAVILPGLGSADEF